MFLPITLIGFFLLGKRGLNRLAVSWLVCCSFFFYSWWNPAYLGLLLCSILFNYTVGFALSRSNQIGKRRKWLLAVGITANVGLLAYYKYTNFFVNEVDRVFSVDWQLVPIMLPLAISFFTFQQIAYLVDAHRGETHEYSFLHYCLFVTYFPQLIAGPIVHHKEMLPQFADKRIYLFSYAQLSIGVTIFTLGLFKMVVLADGVAKYATPVFDAVSHGVDLTIFEAWGGAIAYTLQLYFDFSGYSDMAIGLAAMIGVTLPLNFFSPYKSLNIIEFWRRWHITLSRFLKDYLYIPLGGNQYGRFRRYINIMIVMLLGGLWHGANWTFVIWGGLHGFYIIVNHCWRFLQSRRCEGKTGSTCYINRLMARGLTLSAVIVAWVFFRAENLNDAFRIVVAMFGGNGISLFPGMMERMGLQESMLMAYGIVFKGPFCNGLLNWYWGGGIIFVLLLLVLFAPNTYQIMRKYNPAFFIYQGQPEVADGENNMMSWKFNVNYAVVTGLLLACSLIVIGAKQDISEFIYFQF